MSKPGREILEFKIDAYTPDTLPLARLAEYLSQLAQLYGTKESVHFDKVKKGSAVLRSWVEPQDSNRVLVRVRTATSANANEEARRAYKKLDAMLRENRATGEIRNAAGAKILVFPGRKQPDPKPISINEHAEVDGVVVRVGGIDNTIPVHLQDISGALLICSTKDRAMARELAALLYADPIRVRGQADWDRDADGVWKMNGLIIEGWEPLDTTSAEELFARIRAIPGNGWKKVEDPAAEALRIREGDIPEETISTRRNARHSE